MEWSKSSYDDEESDSVSSFLNTLNSHALQVLSMSRLGGAGAVAPLVTDIPLSSVEVLKENGLNLLFSLFLFRYQQPCFCPNHRKKVVKVVETNRHGINGLMMEQNDKSLSLWKKMLELQCSSFNQRLFASCLSR